MHRTLLCLFIVAWGSFAVADDRRAQVNYMLHCQGCHLPQGEGFTGRVPPMKNFVGYFLHSQEGREFVIRVPGVAHSALNDQELAELVNWLLREFSAAQLPPVFTPFSPDEVAALRQDAETAPETTRLFILENIAGQLPSLKRALRNNNNE